MTEPLDESWWASYGRHLEHVIQQGRDHRPSVGDQLALRHGPVRRAGRALAKTHRDHCTRSFDAAALLSIPWAGNHGARLTRCTFCVIAITAKRSRIRRWKGSGLLVRQASWRGPTGGSPVRVSRSGRPVVSVAVSSATAAANGVTWRDYEQDLKANLEDLHARVHRGAYRPQPSRRVYIPKPDGRQRPLAIAALEDKIVQRATAVVLNAIYEEDFLGFSYGFRPGRSAHDAMDALAVGIEHRKVNFIVDADIRSFFDTVDQQWLTRFVEHRIGDPRIIRLIQK
ncbi:hypothetical protein IVA83_45290, partial [Bradyrhizobium sp. 143]|nr:hypothetical protein [Bradyrhizobium sp. 143]